jgi:hypothetical protein
VLTEPSRARPLHPSSDARGATSKLAKRQPSERPERFSNACPFDRVEVNTDARMQEWRIRKGRECEFLSYWSTRATISNRTGLIAEFLREVDQQRWIQWSTDEDSTTFYNIGLWRDAAHFEEQVGRFIDLDRPQLEFEAAKRRRVFLAPARWRVGGTGLPLADPPGVR